MMSLVGEPLIPKFVTEVFYMRIMFFKGIFLIHAFGLDFPIYRYNPLSLSYIFMILAICFIIAIITHDEEHNYIHHEPDFGFSAL